MTVSQVCSVCSPSFFISASAQRTAAPIPRLGSVCDDSVWRVPKLTSFSTVAFIRAASTLRAMSATFASGAGSGGTASGGGNEGGGRNEQLFHGAMVEPRFGRLGKRRSKPVTPWSIRNGASRDCADKSASHASCVPDRCCCLFAAPGRRQAGRSQGRGGGAARRRPLLFRPQRPSATNPVVDIRDRCSIAEVVMPSPKGHAVGRDAVLALFRENPSYKEGKVSWAPDPRRHLGRRHAGLHLWLPVG